MGNRGTIVLVGVASTERDGKAIIGVERETPLYFSTHWTGDSLEAVARTACKIAADNGRVEGDTGVFARVLFCELLKTEDNDGVLGFRITTEDSDDHDVPPLVIDCAYRTVYEVKETSEGPRLGGILQALKLPRRPADTKRLKKLFTF